MSFKKTKPRNALGTALISVLSISPLAHADQQDNKKTQIEELKVIGHKDGLMQVKNPTASKMNLSFKDTGRSITQLDEQQLKDLALENVRQAFDYVAGFRGNGPADRTYTARGVRTSIDNVMVDGLRSLQGGEAGTGSRLPSTFNAEATTFLRGPAGLLYGAGVGGGLINITTKRPETDAQTSIGLGSRSYVTDGSNFDSNRFTVNLDSTGGLVEDDVLYRVLAQYTPDGDHFQEGRSIDEKLFDVALTFNVGESTRITPRFESTDRERSGGSGYADGVFESNFFSGNVTTYGKPVNRSFYYGSNQDKGENTSRSFSVLFEHELNEDWDLSLRARQSETESESLDLYISDSSGLGNSVGEDEINRKWVYAKGDDEYVLYDAAIEGKFSTAGIEHHLLFGANYRDMDVGFARKFQSNSDAVGKNTISASNPRQQLVGPVPEDLRTVDLSPRNEKDTNIYLKDRVTLGDFTLAGGVAYVKQEQQETRRGTAYSGDFSDTIWDLGVIYALNSDINVFATYSRSYDPVSARWISQYGQGKTSFKPVEGDNYELGIKGDFFDKRLSTGITLFRLERSNSTKFERIDGVWHLTQLEGASFRSEGLEWDASFSLNEQWISNISYAFTRAYDTIGEDEGRQASNTPKHSLALWNTYQFGGDLDNFRLGAGLRFESDRYDGQYILEEYVEADVGVYYDNNTIDASLVLRNAFDKNRAEAGANWVTVQPNDPRSLNLSVRYNF